jgi:hypothetical protein
MLSFIKRAHPRLRRGPGYPLQSFLPGLGPAKKGFPLLSLARKPAYHKHFAHINRKPLNSTYGRVEKTALPHEIIRRFCSTV